MGRRFLGRDDLLQTAEITIVEQPADHIRRNLTRTLGIKLVGAREVEPAIGPGHLRFHAGVKVRVGLDHYYASETVETAVGVASAQQSRSGERHRVSCLTSL